MKSEFFPMLSKLFCSQMAKPQFLRLIPLSQIRKFLRCASPQIAIAKIFMIQPQIANPQISTKYCKTLCLKIVLKVTLLKWFFVLCKKEMYAEVLSPQIAKKIGSANRKSAKCHICDWFANLKNYISPHFCGFLRFLFADAQLCSQ